jgi:hypothetical protein
MMLPLPHRALAPPKLSIPLRLPAFQSLGTNLKRTRDSARKPALLRRPISPRLRVVPMSSPGRAVALVGGNARSPRAGFQCHLLFPAPGRRRTRGADPRSAEAPVPLFVRKS